MDCLRWISTRIAHLFPQKQRRGGGGCPGLYENTEQDTGICWLVDPEKEYFPKPSEEVRSLYHEGKRIAQLVCIRKASL